VCIADLIAGRLSGRWPDLTDVLDKVVVRNYGKKNAEGSPVGVGAGCRCLLRYAEDATLTSVRSRGHYLYDYGQDVAAGEAANMVEYAAGEASVHTVDQAVQSLGGNGLSTGYGLASLVTMSRMGRIAPVSREMILNYLAQNTLGLPKSY
jgi:alkylation response protein AidB-like acyl-CoA dehydrogenase